MMNLLISRSLLINKDRGDRNVTSGVTNLSPQDEAKARKLAGCENIEGMFSQTPLIAVFDGRLHDHAYRILAFLAFASWRTGSASISLEEIAEALNCSERSAIRGISELVYLGYVTAEKAHNRRNTYFVAGRIGSSAASAPASPGVSAGHGRPVVICPTCRQPCRGLLRVGWCRSCACKARIRVIVREEMKATA